MWGSSFADLAKQAAEFQEQAAKKAAELSEQAAQLTDNVTAESAGFTSPAGFGSPSGFFNMDALQNTAEEKDKTPSWPQTSVAKEYLKAEPNVFATPHPRHTSIPDELKAEKGPTTEDDHAAPERSCNERPLQMRQEQQQSQKIPAMPQEGPTIPEAAVTKGDPETDESEAQNGWAEDIELEVEDGLGGNVDPVLSNEEDVFVSNSLEGNDELEEKSEGAAKEENAAAIDHDDKFPKNMSRKVETEDLIRIPASRQKEIPNQPQPSPIPNKQKSVPEVVLQQFSKQLKQLEEKHKAEKRASQVQIAGQLNRLEENYLSEKVVAQERHSREIDSLRQELASAQQHLQQVHTDSRGTVEANKLKIDSLQRELLGTKDLLKDKEKEFKKIQERHLQQLRGMEKEMNKTEDASMGNIERVKSLEKDFEESKVALDKSKEEYSTLKVRVKQVAGELKERRAECRTLASEVKVLNANNVILQDQITQMQGESMDMNQNSVETQKMLNDLKAQLIDKENKLYEAREAIDAEAKKGEDALSSYKKRAQQSLAVANARAASAVQAREEAEMEARAARTTSNSAMERVLIAEQRGKDAQAKAKLDVSGMERELQKLTDVKDALEKAQAELGHVQSEAKNLTETNSKLTCELLSVSGQLEASQKSTEDAQEELSDSQSQSRELFEETERLRGAGRMLKDEIQRLRTSYESKELEEKKEAVEIAQQVERNSEAEATIAMLQRELQDANIAIKELKETVKATVEEAEAAASGNSDARPISQSSVMNEDGSAGGMPLFYAMEKQAELSQARDEIARLANLLGDSEADKQDAKDAMLSMERKMNEAMSKLKRQEQSEKLSPTEERVNLEYLKNVFLSFLNANTPTEKKALLPVIGTILCLTPEEENNALTGLNNNGHVMESVTSSVLRFGGWS